MRWTRFADSRLWAAIGLVLGLALMINASARPGEAQAAASCSAAVTNGNFGSVDLKAGGSATTTASLTFSCTGLIAGTAVTLCPNLDAGSAGYNANGRLMAGPSSSSLNFQIYQDPGDTQTWGTAYFLAFGAAPTLTVTAKADGSASGSATLYASLPAQAAVTPGTYLTTFSGESFIWGLNLLSCAGVTVGYVITPAPFTFTAIVLPNCTVSAGAINFGTQGVLTSSLSAQGSINLACTPNTPFTVGLNGGLSNAASPTARLMTKGAESVTYGLYLDAGFSQPWGAAGGSGSVSSGTGTGSTQTLTVYARAPAQATPSPGTYTDTVVATLTY
jgi:spore coat protein U-like protein